MRVRRPGGATRQRYSPRKTRRDQKTEWYPDSYPSRREEQRAQRPLRNFSPPERENSRRVLVENQRNASMERRDFSSHLVDSKREDDHPRSPFGGRRWIGNREISGSTSQFDEGFAPHRDSPVEFFRKYLHPTDDLEENVGSKHFGGAKNKDKEFQSGAPENGPALDGRGVLLQKSMLLDDGSSRTFFTLPPDFYSSGATHSSKIGSSSLPTSNLDINLHKGKDLRYHDSAIASGARFHPGKVAMKELYDGEEKLKYYPSDSSYPIRPSQSNAFGGNSSNLAKDDFFGSYRDMLRLEPDEFGRGGKFLDPLNRDRVGPSEIFDPRIDSEVRSRDLQVYPRAPVSPARDEIRDYNYPELGRREKGNLDLTSDEVYKKIHPNARDDYTHTEPLRPNFMGTGGERIGGTETSHRGLRDNDIWNHASLQGEAAEKYQDINRVSQMTNKHEEFLGSRNTYTDFGIKASRGHNILHVGEDYSYGRDYGQGLKGPMPEHDLNSYRINLSSQQRSESGISMPSLRMAKRKFVMDTSSNLMNNRNMTSTIQDLTVGDERWMREDQGGFLPSKHLETEKRPQHRTSGRSFDGVAQRKVSRSWVPLEDASVRARGGFIKTRMPLNRRMKPNPFKFQNSFSLNEKQDLHRPFKFRKGNHNMAGGAHLNDVHEEPTAPIKTDPPENSEEFKQQVQRAFLRFSKQLNENPGQQKRYKEQGKAGTLVCIACGSLSKEFMDTHSLVTHAFNSLKVGLRTDHLGLHKAICVLMGWDSLVAPDTSKNYQSLSVDDALGLKEDLILWPPLIIIHNTSIGNNKGDAKEVLTTEHIKEILRDIGFGGGKTKVSQGKRENQNTLLAKFLPTFSGLQEAERLHKYYADNKRGRREWLQLDLNNSNGGEKKIEDFLFGYMGIAEDLDKLDPESKKRCQVKSKTEIQEIADAPLITEPEATQNL